MTSLSLPIVRLQNDFLEAVVCPALGGRIVALVDRRTGADLWRLPPEISLTPGGRRGLVWRHGLELDLPGGRLTSLGSVDWLVREPSSEGGPAAVFLFETSPGIPAAWHLCVSLPPNRAEVLVECRYENRGLGVVEAAPSFVFHGCGLGQSAESFAGLKTPGGTLAVLWEPGSGLSLEDPDAPRLTPAFGSILGPRGIDQYSFRLVPCTDLESLTMANRELALHVSGAALAAQATAPLIRAQVFVQLRTGQTLEARADLNPAKPFKATLDEEITGVQVRDDEGRTVLSWSADEEESVAPLASRGEHALLKAFQGLDESAESEFFRRASAGEATPRAPLGLETAAAWNQARRAVRARDWAEADRWIDTGLQRQANDQLLWWLKSVVARHRGEMTGESTEIVNAHYLAPLEPALRAEAFLSMDQHQGREPNPVTKPLAHNADALLDVMGWLYELGLHGDAARLGDECLRHRETPLVRYFMAWSLLSEARLEAEAAHHVRVAASSPLEPPFPWRPLEVLAVQELAKKFPGDERLAALAAR